MRADRANGGQSNLYFTTMTEYDPTMPRKEGPASGRWLEIVVPGFKHRSSVW